MLRFYSLIKEWDSVLEDQFDRVMGTRGIRTIP